MKARDEVNLQYVERLLVAEKLLAKSDKEAGGEFEALQARLKKDRGAQFNCFSVYLLTNGIFTGATKLHLKYSTPFNNS